MMSGLMVHAACLATGTLWRRELVRFFRQRNRVVGALGTPVVFWLLLGSGFRGAFQVSPTQVQGASDVTGAVEAGQITYLQYFYPGSLLMVLLFTAIFATISVIEDRKTGFLQGVLVAPVPRASIVLGKVLGGASIAMVQAILFLLIWPFVNGWPSLAQIVGVLWLTLGLAVGMTALGLYFAWPMDSVAGFHAIMNLILMPMWFLSGAVFPLESAPVWMRAMMWLNPLTYGHIALSTLMTGSTPPAGQTISTGLAAAMTWLFIFIAVVAAWWQVNRSRKWMST